MLMTTHAKRADVADGLLNVNKPRDWTSHDIVAKLRGGFGGAKVGHGGTLDPAATGVLPILIGRATRIAEYLLDWDKEYRAVMRLGESTDTQDADGSVVTRRPTEHVTEAAVREAAARFTGRIRQMPPMYSAVKVAGVPLYKTARAGKTVDRSSREIIVHDLEVLEVDGPTITLRVRCSKGTYVRTLCADIGEALGVGGHVRCLERTRVGPLALEESITIDDVLAYARLGRLNEIIVTLDRALHHLPALTVTDGGTARARHGGAIGVESLEAMSCEAISSMPAGQRVRVKSAQGTVLAVGAVHRESGPSPVVRMVKVLADDGQQEERA